MEGGPGAARATPIQGYDIGIRVGSCKVLIGFEDAKLGQQFVWVPVIVGRQKCDEFAARTRYGPIVALRDPLVLLVEKGNDFRVRVRQSLDHEARVVRRSIVDDD